MFKFKIEDTVKVTSGKDKGRAGKIMRVFPKSAAILIDGVNIYKKHVKGSPTSGGQKGGIYEIPRPLSVAKIALVCPNCKKQTRVAFRVVDGKSERICAKCKKAIKTKGEAKK